MGVDNQNSAETTVVLGTSGKLTHQSTNLQVRGLGGQ